MIRNLTFVFSPPKNNSSWHSRFFFTKTFRGEANTSLRIGNMDEDLLSNFNVMEPVFARKSAPPPPPAEQGSPDFSTPSSSLLDTSTEASSALSNSGNRNPPIPGSQSQPQRTQQRDHQSRQKDGAEEPMEQDLPQDPPLPQPPHFDETPGKHKTRNRSRSKRAEAKKIGPDVPSLLAELEKDDLPPPPLPTSQPPPPPPLPTSGLNHDRTDNEEDHDQGRNSDKKGAQAKDTIKKGGKSGASKKKTNRAVGEPGQENEDPGRRSAQSTSTSSRSSSSSSTTSSARRTLGAIPKLHDKIPSHNRQWKQGDPVASTSGTQGEAGREPTAGQGGTVIEPSMGSSHQIDRRDHDKTNNRPTYHTKPGGAQDVCYDLSSFRFLPDDDRRISIVRRKMRGDPPEHNDQTIAKTTLHQFPEVFSNEVTGVELDDAPGASSLGDTGDRFMTIIDFASPEPNSAAVFHTITRRDYIVFVIVSRPESARGKISWDFPTLVQCQDFSNEFISKIYEENRDWAKAYVRSGRWGKIGTILLSLESPDHMTEFRRNFSLMNYRGESFDTFPRDALTARPDVSILLRASMKTFKTEIIPKVLFVRNQSLIACSLKVLSTRFHSAQETSHKGESKEFWRTVDLKGNDQLMRCLRFIPESQPFLLGYDSVQIRGGLRPQENNTAIAGNKRQWSEYPVSAVPLLSDPRNIFPSPSGNNISNNNNTSTIPDENSNRGAAKRGRGSRGGRRGSRGNKSRFGRQF